MKIYLVGGAVRDRLLKRPVKERDWVVVGATPEAMVALGYRPVGKDFPVFLHPETNEEYALARTERKVGPGYHGFTCIASPEVTLEEDLKRRDLTINAIAETSTGDLIDPYGGVKDIHDRVLRHVSPAFVEDPVRILRLARFTARYSRLGFHVAAETMMLLRQMVVQGEANQLVAERVWQELERALGETDPDQFFVVLRECWALAAIFPEIDRLWGVPQSPQRHPEIDTGVHTLMVLVQATRLTSSLPVRFAALVHDLGKGETPAAEWPSHHGHEDRGVKIINTLAQRLRLPKAITELAVLVAKYHTHCHRALELTFPTLLKTLEKLDAFRRPERFRDFLLACEADARGRTGHEDEPYPQADYFARAYEAAAGVDLTPLVQRGLAGLLMANAVYELRLQAIVERLGSERPPLT